MSDPDEIERLRAEVAEARHRELNLIREYMENVREIKRLRAALSDDILTRQADEKSESCKCTPKVMAGNCPLHGWEGTEPGSLGRSAAHARAAHPEVAKQVRAALETDARRDSYGTELPPISESDGALYAAISTEHIAHSCDEECIHQLAAIAGSDSCQHVWSRGASCLQCGRTPLDPPRATYCQHVRCLLCAPYQFGE